jgi:hypothetical protein
MTLFTALFEKLNYARDLEFFDEEPCYELKDQDLGNNYQGLNQKLRKFKKRKNYTEAKIGDDCFGCKMS